jgi:hypothetical protein
VGFVHVNDNENENDNVNDNVAKMKTKQGSSKRRKGFPLHFFAFRLGINVCKKIGKITSVCHYTTKTPKNTQNVVLSSWRTNYEVQ